MDLKRLGLSPESFTIGAGSFCAGDPCERWPYIYNLCRYVVEESMGQALLRLLLQIPAESETPLTLTELAQRLRRSAGVTAPY